MKPLIHYVTCFYSLQNKFLLRADYGRILTIICVCQLYIYRYILREEGSYDIKKSQNRVLNDSYRRKHVKSDEIKNNCQGLYKLLILTL